MSKSSKLSFLPDSVFLRIKFFFRMRQILHLSNPKTFNEKLQWLKINDRKDIYTQLVDKYRARDFVKEIVGEEYLNELYGVYNSFDEMDFSKLPEEFVVKCNHDCGSILICRDKSKIDFVKEKEKFDRALHNNYYLQGREWPYKNVKPCIIVEKYLCDDNNNCIRDYKFFCFNGEPRFLYVSEGLENHKTAKISFYDLDGNEMNFKRSDYAAFDKNPIPDKIDELKNIAAVLSKEINAPFLRVDLYLINGKIYFSEFTFFPCGGMLPFEPKEYDKVIGDMLVLPSD